MNIQSLLLIAPPILLALTFHEYAHAYVAHRYGDDTAQKSGRLTLNPLRHLDPLGTIMIFLVQFGWAKPVPVNVGRFHPQVGMRAGVLLTAAAGPAGGNAILNENKSVAVQYPPAVNHNDIVFTKMIEYQDGDELVTAKSADLLPRQPVTVELQLKNNSNRTRAERRVVAELARTQRRIARAPAEWLEQRAVIGFRCRLQRIALVVQPGCKQQGPEKHQGNQQEAGLGQGVVGMTDGENQFPADTRPCEYRFGQCPAVDGKCQAQSHAGHHGQGRVGRRVAVADMLFFDPLGSGRINIFFFQGVQHAASHDEHVAAEVDNKQGHERQQHMVHHIEGACPPPGLRVDPDFRCQDAVDGKPPDAVPEEPDHQQSQPWQKQGMADERSQRHPRIDRAPLVPGHDFSQPDPHGSVSFHRVQHGRGPGEFVHARPYALCTGAV